AVEQHVALGALVGIEVIHAIKYAQQRRFSTARRPDEGRDPALVERDVDVLQGFGIAVIEVEVSDRNLLGQAGRADRGMTDGGDGDRRYVHDCFLDPARARAPILSASTVKVMISAPVQASFCQSA